MCEKIIKKGRHYCSPFPWPKFYLPKDTFQVIKKVRFNDDCNYDIDTDQSDVNKLFGVSYGLHHKQSDRIGWRYLKQSNKIEIVLYSYINGVRASFPLMKCDLNEYYTIELCVHIHDDKRIVDVYVDSKQLVSQTFFHKKYCFGYTLGLYFGGNRAAPHDMHIRMI